MTKLQRYTKEHTATVTAMKALLERTDDDGRLSAEQQKEYDALDEKRKVAAAAMKREAEVEAADLAAIAVTSVSAGDPAGEAQTAGLARPRPRPRGGRTYAEMFGAPAPSAFATPEEFFRTVHSGLSDPRLMAASQRENTGVSGGFAVPEEVVGEMLDASLETEIVRPRAKLEPMTSHTKSIWGFDASTAASGILYGGFTPTWLPEEGSIPIGAAKLKMLSLVAHNLALLGVASNQLIADGGSFEADLQSVMVKAAGWGLDNAFLTGNGVGEPLGVAGDPALIVVAKETGQLAATIVYENLAKMFSRLHPACIGNAVWVANPNTIPQLLQVTIGVGTGGVYFPVLQQDTGRFFIFGREVLFTEKLATLGAQGDIILADFSQYAVGMRREAFLDKSQHLGFQTDQTYYRCIVRADGRGRWTKAYTPKTGSTLSWCVALAAR